MAMGDGTDRANWMQAALLDDPEFLRGLVERTLQTILDEEMTAHLGVERYERSSERRGYRNGYKPRTLTSRVGTLELAVPQDRDGTFSTELFGRYQRTDQALVLTLMEMYVQGVSTRKVAAVTEALCGTRFSKSQVSALTGRLDSELATWRERPLTAPSYPYVWVDARYEHVRVDGRVISQGVLLVTGLRGDDGRRELLGVAVADTESEATYQELFRSLKARGLSGVRLVLSDDHAGLRQAIHRQFQGAGWQRCQVHVTRNLLGQVAKSKRAEVAAGLREGFAAPTYSQAMAVAHRLASQWQSSHPRVVDVLEEELEACLACLTFPPAHQLRIRTTKGMERLSQELKRRTRVVRIFPNREACLRLVTALAMEQSDEWVSGRRYLDVSLLSDTHRELLPAALAADGQDRRLGRRGGN
jgi:transposase-like protein